MLRESDTLNFKTLVEAAKADRLCLLEGKTKKNGKYRALICAVNLTDDGEGLELLPLGHMATGNPYEQYKPADDDAVDNATKIYLQETGLFDSDDEG